MISLVCGNKMIQINLFTNRSKLTNIENKFKVTIGEVVLGD